MTRVYSKQISMILFIAIQLGIVLIHISKNALWIKVSYSTQKHEQQYRALMEQKKLLLHTLYTLQNHGEIKHYAQKKLGMHSVVLGRLKKVV